MTTMYKTAFSLSILCEYYTTLQSHDFEIIPSKDTSKQLQNYGMRTRFSEGKLFVSIRTDTSGKVLFLPPENTKLRFRLKLKNQYFINLANINLSELDEKKFYFSNLTGARSENTPSITRPIKDYRNDQSYKPGDLAKADTIIYECTKTVNGEQNTVNTGHWIAKENNHYASREDMFTFINPVHTFKLSIPANVFNVKIYTHTSSDPNPIQEVYIPDDLQTSSKEPTDNVQLNLRHLTPGYYRISINDELFDIYMDNQASAPDYIGVVEIFPYTSTTEGSFIDKQGYIIKNPSANPDLPWQDYTILFANRRIFWKYVSTRNSILSVRDSLYQFNQHYSLTEKTNYFLSDRPIPLREIPRMIMIDVPVQSGNSPIRVSVPDPRSIGNFSQYEDNFYYTIFLNY